MNESDCRALPRDTHVSCVVYIVYIGGPCAQGCAYLFGCLNAGLIASRIECYAPLLHGYLGVIKRKFIFRTVGLPMTIKAMALAVATYI